MVDNEIGSENQYVVNTGPSMNRVTELVTTLKSASDAYYNDDPSSLRISDSEYDSLVEELRGLDPDNGYLKNVGTQVSGLFTEVRHSLPMGSLEKCKGPAEIQKWWDKLPIKRVSYQWKFDGLSLSLKYESGRLTQAVSRGDGETGEDLTQNILKSKYIPKRLSAKFTGFVRGEAILFKEDFDKYFKPNGFANPRNACGGAIRSKDGNGSEHVRFLPFDMSVNIVEGDDGPSITLGLAKIRTEQQKMDALNKLGFDVRLCQVLSSVEAVLAAYDACTKVRDSQPFEVDGVVLKCDDIKLATAMGASDNRPKAQRAVKFGALGAETVVERIEWSNGHTGAVIPTFKIKPVQVGGVTISSILLNNLGYMEALDIGIGDKIEVERAGDVIPHVRRVIERTKERNRNVPNKCPACGGKLKRDGLHLMCTNVECSGKLIRKVRRWLDALDIKFIGDEVERALWDAKLVRDPADLYTLTLKDLVNLKVGNGEYGEARAKQILAEIDKTREMPLNMFFGSLGIKFLGTRAANHFVKDYGVNSMEKFLDTDGIRKNDKIGPIIRKEVADEIDRIKPLIEKLLKHVKVAETVKETGPLKVNAGQFAGRSCCFTGVRPTSDERKKFESQGGVVKDSVSKNLTHLVVKDIATSSNKAMKATEYGVQVITYVEFQAWLK